MDANKIDGWKYPQLKELKKFQESKGLHLDMLNKVEVRELICGVSSNQEITEVQDWISKSRPSPWTSRT